MNEDLGDIQYFPIRNHQYEKWFQERHYDEDNFSDIDRAEYLEIVDISTSHFKEGLPILKETLERIKNLHDEYNETYRIVISAILFTSITMIDGLILSKYFIVAENDYDKRLMRGKLKVILNEGFKKLYGFGENSRKKTEWSKLIGILKYFPDEITCQYQKLSSLLEKHSESSSWWREERDVETHLDTEKLYASRCENIKESQVIIDFLKLFETLNAVILFLSNMHICLNNYLIYKYRRGELREV